MADRAKEFTKSDEDDLRVIEQLLDVVSGTLKGMHFAVERTECKICHRTLRGSDLVDTAIRDAGHSRELIFHSLYSRNPRPDNPPRPISCRVCRKKDPNVDVNPAAWSAGRYSCARPD